MGFAPRTPLQALASRFALRRTYGNVEETKKRRIEGCDSRPPRRPEGPASRPSENRKDKQHMMTSCLSLRFTGGLTRKARSGGRHVADRLAHQAPPDVSLRVLRLFDAEP